MLVAAAHALADATPQEHLDQGQLYPDIKVSSTSHCFSSGQYSCLTATIQAEQVLLTASKAESAAMFATRPKLQLQSADC
jgi:hypothetical protein